MNSADFEWHYREIEIAIEKERAIIKRLRADANKATAILGDRCEQLEAEIAKLQTECDVTVEQHDKALKANAKLRAALKDAADTLEANGFACGQARAALANK